MDKNSRTPFRVFWISSAIYALVSLFPLISIYLGRNRSEFLPFVILAPVVAAIPYALTSLQYKNKYLRNLGFTCFGLIFIVVVFLSGISKPPATCDSGSGIRVDGCQHIIRRVDGTLALMPHEPQFFNFSDKYIIGYPTHIRLPKTSIDIQGSKVQVSYHFVGGELMLPDNEEAILRFHRAVEDFKSKLQEVERSDLTDIVIRMTIQSDVKEALREYTQRTEPTELAATQSIILDWDRYFINLPLESKSPLKFQVGRVRIKDQAEKFAVVKASTLLAPRSTGTVYGIEISN